MDFVGTSKNLAKIGRYRKFVSSAPINFDSTLEM